MRNTGALHLPEQHHLCLGPVLGLLLMVVVQPLLGVYTSCFGVALVAGTFFVAFFFVR